MRLFNTAGLDEAMMRSLTPDEAAHIYNGLDCCVTFEVYESLMRELSEAPDNVRYTYEMALAKQAPMLEMSMRGIRVDLAARDRARAELKTKIEELDSRFQRIMREVFDCEINWRSPTQLKMLFYGILGLKEIRKRNTKGEFAATVNEDALNQLCLNFYAQPLALYILKMRELGKKLGFLETELDPDGRIRCNINIAGTNTGRLSSSFNDFGTGTNLQNVDTSLRSVFIPDDGYMFVNVDLEQADARNVAAIIHEVFYGQPGYADYLDACESGDLHTRVCRMAWSELPWPEDPKEWRPIADQIAYRAFSYRDLAKRLGHGTNYYGQPFTMAKHTHTEKSIIELFQQKYFGAFPLIQKWHQWTINEIKTSGVLTTLYGRRRFFFGRGDDAATWRKAIAYCPQSMTGHQIDMGILNLWRNNKDIQLLMQVHDSILFQVPVIGHERYVEEALRLLRYSITLTGGREFAVPLEAKTGFNWGNREEDKKTGLVTNPLGLQKWKGQETRVPPKYKSRLNALLD